MPVEPAAAPDARDPADLDQDVQNMLKKRAFWAQPWMRTLTGGTGTVRREHLEELERRKTRWLRERPKRWHPARNRATQLWASSACRLHGHDDDRILVELLELDPTTDSYRPRHRTLRTVIARGDALWAALGAWPWAAFPEAPPARWWQDARAVNSLAELLESTATAAQDDARRARERHQALTAWASALRSSRVRPPAADHALACANPPPVKLSWRWTSLGLKTVDLTTDRQLAPSLPLRSRGAVASQGPGRFVRT